MDDFSLPDSANAFGLLGSAANAPAPGKRPLSSMSPVVVLEGDRVQAVVGAAGGPQIISTTARLLVDLLDFKLDPQLASDAPRLQTTSGSLTSCRSRRACPAGVLSALTASGHRLVPRTTIGLANVVVRAGGGWAAAAERRSGGGPAGN
jgi:gamma-glutamyltranspeptidase/glutathione hydrolase